MLEATVKSVVARALATIDLDAMARLRAKYGDSVDGPKPEKYLDVGRWVAICAQRAVAIGLHESSPKRVLDIGTGAAYFPLVCRVLGHDAVATDWSGRDRIYYDITSAIGVDVQDLDIGPNGWSMPGTFDVISAFMVTFNGHKVEPWGPAQWRTFLDSANAHLNSGGRLVLELNAEADGRRYTPELKQLFIERGAEITAHWPHPPYHNGHRLVFMKP